MRKTSTPEDWNALAVRLKDGDERAGAAIFEKFAPLFFGFFLQRTGIKGVDEDLVQEVFVKLVGRIETFNPSVGNFTPWFWQIARNTLNDYFRERKNVSLSGIEDVEEDEFAIDESLDTKEFVSEILNKVKEFSEEDQDIFLMRYIEGLSYREMSAALGKTEVSLRVAAHRLIKKIKNLYHD